MTIYDRIKARRIELGMSQGELAEKVGYQGRSAISKVEAGARDISSSMICKYAEALRVSRMWLITGEEEKASEPESTDAVKDVIEQFNQLDAASRDKVLAEIIKTLSSH